MVYGRNNYFQFIVLCYEILEEIEKKGYQGRQKVESRVKQSESQFSGGGRKRLSFFLYPWAGKIGKKREKEAIA